MPYHVFVYQFGIEFRVIEHMGTRPDDAHVPPQDIEELGKLVQIGLAHEIAERELARVIFGCLRRVRLVVDVHAAELVTPEAGSVQSGPFLSEEHRAWTLQLYAEGNDRDERQEEDAYQGTDDDVEKPFDEFVSHVRQRFHMIGEKVQTAHAFCP